MPDYNYISNMVSQWLQQMLNQQYGQQAGGVGSGGRWNPNITPGTTGSVSPSGRSLTPFTQQQLQQMAAGGDPNAIHALGGPAPAWNWNQPQQYRDASAWVADFEARNGRKPTTEERMNALDPATISRNQSRTYGYTHPQTTNTNWATQVMNSVGRTGAGSPLPGGGGGYGGGGYQLQEQDPLAPFRVLSRNRIQGTTPAAWGLNGANSAQGLIGGANIGGNDYFSGWYPGKTPPLPTALMNPVMPGTRIGSPPSAPVIPQPNSNPELERFRFKNQGGYSF